MTKFIDPVTAAKLETLHESREDAEKAYRKGFADASSAAVVGMLLAVILGLLVGGGLVGLGVAIF